MSCILLSIMLSDNRISFSFAAHSSSKNVSHVSVAEGRIKSSALAWIFVQVTLNTTKSDTFRSVTFGVKDDLKTSACLIYASSILLLELNRWFPAKSVCCFFKCIDHLQFGWFEKFI